MDFGSLFVKLIRLNPHAWCEWSVKLYILHYKNEICIFWNTKRTFFWESRDDAPIPNQSIAMVYTNWLPDDVKDHTDMVLAWRHSVTKFGEHMEIKYALTKIPPVLLDICWHRWSHFSMFAFAFDVLIASNIIECCAKFRIWIYRPYIFEVAQAARIMLVTSLQAAKAVNNAATA